jgi:hypothetical protein
VLLHQPSSRRRRCHARSTRPHAPRASCLRRCACAAAKPCPSRC